MKVLFLKDNGHDAKIEAGVMSDNETAWIEVAEVMGTYVGQSVTPPFVWIKDGVKTYLSIAQFRELHQQMTAVLNQIDSVENSLDINRSHG